MVAVQVQEEQPAQLRCTAPWVRQGPYGRQGCTAPPSAPIKHIHSFLTDPPPHPTPPHPTPPTTPPIRAGKTWCGGSVLQCLSSSYGDIQDDKCQAEVEFFRRMRAKGDLR